MSLRATAVLFLGLGVLAAAPLIAVGAVWLADRLMDRRA